MLDNRKLFVDTMSEVYDLLKPWADGEFWNLTDHEPEPGSIYLFGRQHFIENKDRIVEMANSGKYTIVFGNPAEGSWTLASQIQMLGIEPLILEGKILLLGGADMDSAYPYLSYEYFLSCILDYEENLAVMANSNQIYEKTNKPYKFLFLNGRARPHRKYLYERFRQLGLLEQSLWTMLDSRPSPSRSFRLFDGTTDLMRTASELKWLPKYYEIETYQDATVNADPTGRTFVKHELFKNQWGEIYLRPEPYCDTYFSLVTETVVEQPWSFRTEKIAKPLAIGHPWIAVSGPGYYRDLRNLGFQTFTPLIDESFDLITDPQQRVDRIIDIVTDLCRQDLAKFQQECYNICKYNQQHLQELAVSVRKEFPERFKNFIKKYERS